MPKIQVLLALIAVAIAAVLASANSFQLSTQLQPDPWSIEPAIQRFAAVAERLPAAGAVGYISDLPLADRGTAAFLSAQYALPPRLLVPVEQTQLPLAIGNFSQPADFAEAGAKDGYRVEADLGNGVVLYRKATP
jgi:hypothetical protein